MDISGNQKVRANRQQVFQALLDPAVLKSSVPGCESAEFVEFPTGRQLKLVVSPNLPGFKGPYNIFLQTGEVIAPSRVVMIAEPTSSFGSVKATCAIDLADDAEGTQLSYKAEAEVSGKIAGVPDIAINTAVKMGLGQFFKNFEKQVSAARV
ncbi:MAG TPA: SRPBCC domain-containing protein [Ktedonobacteraceae bacterium]|nr:SRPBCC domain-containing protein [Chthonomonadales bacterium]HEV2579626.1 SRPBCC domain-containing protein [Ktedonobacteraceae bacterium]